MTEPIQSIGGFSSTQRKLDTNATALQPEGRNKGAEFVYNSYSGSDCIAQIVVPGNGPMMLGEVSTISYSSHRENNPVRFLGRVNPAAFVKGPRLIAGSIIFTVFNYYAFYRIALMRNAVNKNLYPLADMLPPFDLVLTFSNEVGAFSKMKILGLTIVDEGGTMSIDDLIVEQTFSFMARGIEPMTPIAFNNYSAGKEEPKAHTAIEFL